jgi:hypothetical protein
MADDDPLMTVATFDILMEAELARGYLESEGIRCFLADAEMVNTAWYMSGAMGGIKLQVAKADFLTAERLLHNRRRSRDLDDYGLKGSTDAITTQPGRLREEADPEEPEEPPENANEALVGAAFRAAILGLVLCPPLLQLYSVFLLSQVGNRPEPLSDRHRTQFWIAAVVDSLVLLVAVALAALIVLSGLTRH